MSLLTQFNLPPQQVSTGGGGNPLLSGGWKALKFVKGELKISAAGNTSFVATLEVINSKVPTEIGAQIRENFVVAGNANLEVSLQRLQDFAFSFYGNPSGSPVNDQKFEGKMLFVENVPKLGKESFKDGKKYAAKLENQIYPARSAEKITEAAAALGMPVPYHQYTEYKLDFSGVAQPQPAQAYNPNQQQPYQQPPQQYAQHPQQYAQPQQQYAQPQQPQQHGVLSGQPAHNWSAPRQH